MPSTLIPPSACCRSVTCRPWLPTEITMLCSVVVAGPAADAGPDSCPLATAAVGPTVSAARAPSETRFALDRGGAKRS